MLLNGTVQTRTSYQVRAYRNRHRAVQKAQGKATEHVCVRCPEPAINWATIHGETGDDPWADYVPLCGRCHSIYDGRTGRPRPHARGEDRPAAKLTEVQVREIRAALNRGASLAELGRAYGVSAACIHLIRNGATWSWLI